MVPRDAARRQHAALEARMTARAWLPARVTPLVGRTEELAELAALLAEERLVTLTGSGGCGKTRLALELAVRVADRFPADVTWVDLAACTDLDDVVGTVAAGFTILEAPGQALQDSVIRVLSTRPEGLLVLDNAEHVLAAVADLVAAVIASAPTARVVCTSREPVGVPGEVVWRVPSLRTPPADQATDPTPDELLDYDAVLLFVERAQRARRGFALNDANAAAVARICRRLDGVPLAIELAAARVRTMPPERISARLDDRFRLLAGGPRTVLARQQTLQASVAWSEDLLDDTERTVFRRLGVFAGGFTIEAVEAVLAAFGDVDPYEAAETVGRLVDKSLVQLDEERDRYALLDTIRSYALQRLLDTAESERARDAHADWCAQWLEHAAEPATTAGVNEWWDDRLATIERVGREWPNCAAALDWVEPGSPPSLRLAAGLGDYWGLRQRANDSARYGMPALLAGDRDDPAWLTAVVALQTVRTNAADAAFGTLREEALILAKERGDRRAVLRLELAGHIAMVLLAGPRDDLLAALAEVRAEALEIGEWYTAWNASQSPAVILVACGRVAEAEALVDGLTSARALLIRSLAAQERGDAARSAALALEAEATIDASLGAAMDRILVAFRAASAALLTADGAVLDAPPLSPSAHDALPRPLLGAYALAGAVDEVLCGRLEEARSILGAEPPDLFTSWRAVCLLAQVELALDDADAARGTARRLRDAAAGVPAPLFQATADLVLAECERPLDANGSLDLAHAALATAVEHELWPVAIDALEAIGALLVDVGRHRDAARLLAAAETARAECSYHYRFAHRAAYVAAAHEATQADDGWAEGAALALVAAVEVAQRMRGDRVRPLAGWESLTPTELRVVEQVAAGHTNPEIAAALLMSRATVKTHLVHVYAKLGFSNRAELAASTARRAAR